MDTVFDRDTAVRRLEPPGTGAPDAGAALAGLLGTSPPDAGAAPVPSPPVPHEALFETDISPDWRAGRGPHGGYLAAIILRALTETVDDLSRTARSLTI
ncbi:MAG TPA: acyl-CoA thioesterase domain-containing protein, partial [Solirubrobacteraceae bacterium]|nr:acyl-CoA thioesterase domain-containing protein [Solirubrobacteraceae bacterium]